MSIQIKNAMILDKKNSDNKIAIDFNADESMFTSIVSENLKDQKLILDILINKKKINSGKYIVDMNDKADRRFAKNNIAVIKANKFLINFKGFDKSFIKALHFNRKFRLESAVNYITNKYEYLSYKGTNANQTDINLREKIDSLISGFIQSTIEIEEKWLEEFKLKMEDFFNLKSQELKADIPEFLRTLFNNYGNFNVKMWTNYLMETFLQSLWDKVYFFTDVASSCHCEYNAIKNKDKNVRKLKNQLNYRQHTYIVKKFLKSIDIKINDCKKQNISDLEHLKKLELEILLETKLNSDLTEKSAIETMMFWKKISNDQYNEFKDQQEHVFFTNLVDEAMQIRGKIIELVHSYHLKLLSNTIEYIDKSTFDKNVEEFQNKILDPEKQANNLIDELKEKLGLNEIENQSNKVKSFLFNLIWAYYRKKQNIITFNTFENLEKKEIEYILKIINNFGSIEKKLAIINIEKEIFNLPNLNSNQYVYKDKLLLENNFEIDLIKNPENYSEKIFYKYNKIQFKHEKKNELLFEKTKVKINHELTGLESHILINPFKIKVNKKNINNLVIEYSSKIIKNNLFKDPNMHLVYTDSGRKILVYSDIQNFKTIFIDEDSIIKYI